VAARNGQILRIPIAHGEGNYYAEPEVIERLEKNRQIVFRYVTVNGDVTDGANPNGSVHNIAGLTNETRNVVGLMPHPERACELAVGSDDGLVLFESAVKSLATAGAVSVVGK
jgi:phosphoribosylformylglycinamidine synthase